MNQEYRLDREYSIAEIIQCNLRKWWLALICAAVCAAVLGGYKYKSLKPFIEQSVYENVKQVTATLYVADYTTAWCAVTGRTCTLPCRSCARWKRKTPSFVWSGTPSSAKYICA